jgi:hypothetical protein
MLSHQENYKSINRYKIINIISYQDCDTEKENITNLQNEPFQYNSERPVTPPNNKIKKRKPPSQKKIYIEAKKKKE